MRDLLQIVEIDLDRCTRVYGTAPCAAVLGTTGVRKCFNTFKTCQDEANYDRASLTLRFGPNQGGLPMGQTIFPALQSVSTNPTILNIAGTDQSQGPLGRRERVTVKLQDFTYSDTLTDPYAAGRVDGTAQTDEGSYNPATRGTFFGKMRARNPYYYGRPLRVLNGYVGDDLGAMRTQHYIIDEWSGPDVNGAVTIVAKDVLSLADNDKALCPVPSQGKIAAAMTAGYTGNVALTPAGIGAEYPTAGKAAIGSEIVSYTRIGDTAIIASRGVSGSAAASHSVGDTFQDCYVLESATLSQAVYDQLVNYAGIDAAYCDLPAWDAETERWMPGLVIDTVIPKPTGVLTLLAELAQLGPSIWWDGVAQEVRYRLNRLADILDTVSSLTDAANILEGSLAVEDRPDLRLSQVALYYGPVNYAAGMTSPENFARAHVAVDLDAEGANQFDQAQVRTLFSRWIGESSDSAARAIVSRILLRFRDIPTDVSFDLDIKDVGVAGLAELLEVQSRVLQSDTGAATARQMQIIQSEETVPGHRMRVTAQTYAFRGRYGFIAEDGRGDYAAATAEEARLGSYIVGASEVFADGTGPYQLF